MAANTPRKIREEIRTSKIDLSEIIREALESKVKKKIEKLLRELENMKNLQTQPDETVKLIRERAEMKGRLLDSSALINCV